MNNNECSSIGISLAIFYASFGIINLAGFKQ
jgi:hypothetical protein